MAKEKYTIIEKDEPEFPARELVQSEDGKFTFSVFGPDYFSSNVKEMNKTYSHPDTGKKITFREPTISESINLASYDFENFAQKIVNGWKFQAGRHVQTQEGIYTNTNETDENVLNNLLNDAEKVNGIYFIDDKIAFIPYDSFKRGDLEVEEFVEQGLARGLEHTTKKKAEKLERIASKENYSNGVWVDRWNSINEPVQRISEFGSSGNDGRLEVTNVNEYGCRYGRAFGILDKKNE